VPARGQYAAGVTDLAQCISRSCTTGWLDWVHGQLWLTPAGLIRRRLTMAESKANGLGPTVSEPLITVDVSAFDTVRLLAEHRTNKILYFDAVSRARLVKGVTADGLRLTMRDGAHHKLLWLTRDPAYAILAAALPGALGIDSSCRDEPAAPSQESGKTPKASS
jgi:hypothetical protein